MKTALNSDDIIQDFDEHVQEINQIFRLIKQKCYKSTIAGSFLDAFS